MYKNEPLWHRTDPTQLELARIEWAIDTVGQELLPNEVSRPVAERLAGCLAVDPSRFYATAGLKAFPDQAADRSLDWRELSHNPNQAEHDPKKARELLGICVYFLCRLPENHELWQIFEAHHDFYKQRLGI